MKTKNQKIKIFKPKKGVNNNDGVVLIGVLALSLILSISLAGILSVTSTETNLSRDLNNSTRALYISEAGISLAEGHLWNLVSNPPSGTQTLYPFGSNPVYPPGSSDSYQISITPDANNPTKDLKGYTVQSAGTSNGRQRTIETVVRMESFAKFAYFSNNEYNSRYRFYIWFTSGDAIRGPLHSNDQISINRNPLFDGLVTSTSSFFNFYNGGPPADNPTFQEGYQLNADPITLPTDLSILTDKVAQGGLNIRGNSLITLNSDGTMTYTSGFGRSARTSTVNLSSINGTVYVNGTAAIRGTLNGRLTIGSNADMLIVDNVVYNDDPQTNPNSTDALGLVSEQDIVVWRNAPRDVKIDGVLMALQNSFEVQDYNRRGNLKGTLSVYGGIIQEFRGPVGTFSRRTGQMVTGYAKNYTYDERMRTNPPPGFPLTGKFERTSWREI